MRHLVTVRKGRRDLSIESRSPTRFSRAPHEYWYAPVSPSVIGYRDRLTRPVWSVLQHPPTLATIRLQVVTWMIVLAAGGILLHGRFDWSAPFAQAAEVAYVLSFFFFVLLLPLTFYGTWILAREPRLPLIVCLLEVVLYAFPYRTLGLGALRHDDVLIRWSGADVPIPADITWFPQAFATTSFGHDVSIVGVGFVILAATIVGIAQRRFAGRQRRNALLVVATLGILFVQTLLHSGLRSPYTYTGHFEPNHVAGYWWHDYMLSNGNGAVNGDEPHFLQVDQTFKGVKDVANPTLLYRRGFIHYLVAPVTYFFSSYNVFLIVNPLLWLIAVICTYDVIRRVFDSTEIARYTAALVACGNGFTYFIAQPMSYNANFVSAIVVIFAVERLAANETGPWRIHLDRALLMGVVLGLAALTYDFFNVYPMLLLYAAYRRRSVVDCAIGCCCGAFIYAAYLFVYLRVLAEPDSTGNSSLATNALSGITDLLGHFAPGDLLVKTVGLLSSYFANLSFAFLVVVFLLALAAIVVCRNNHWKVFICLMLVPSLLLNIYLYYGGIMWGPIPLSTLPRLSYIAYPGIYAAAAVSLAAIGRAAGRWRFGTIVPWAMIALIGIWQNADAFGIPALQYHFYWPTPSPIADSYHR